MAPTPAPEETARARVYHRRQLALSLLGLVLSVAYLLLLIETRAAAHLARHVARWTTASDPVPIGVGSRRPTAAAAVPSSSRNVA